MVINRRTISDLRRDLRFWSSNFRWSTYARCLILFALRFAISRFFAVLSVVSLKISESLAVVLTIRLVISADFK